MSKEYRIKVKPPFSRAIWAGPNTSEIVASRESDKHRAMRESIGNKLENLTGEKPKWSKTIYSYTAVLTEEQVKEVKEWNMVRSVTEV